MDNNDVRAHLIKAGFVFDFSKPLALPATPLWPSRQGFTFSGGTGTTPLQGKYDDMIDAWVIVIVHAADPAIAAGDLQAASAIAVNAVPGDGVRHFRIESWGGASQTLNAIFEIWHHPAKEPSPDAIETGKKAMMAIATHLWSLGYESVAP